MRRTEPTLRPHPWPRPLSEICTIVGPFEEDRSHVNISTLSDARKRHLFGYLKAVEPDVLVHINDPFIQAARVQFGAGVLIPRHIVDRALAWQPEPAHA